MPKISRAGRLQAVLDYIITPNSEHPACLNQEATAVVRLADRLMARWQLAELLGAGEELPSAATLEMRITRLRRKLTAVGAEPPCIRSVYNRGYVLSSTVTLE